MRDWGLQDLSRGNANHFPLEPLLRSVHHPRGVDFADLFLEAQRLGVLLEVLEVMEPRLVAAGQELFGHDRLRLDVDDLGPVVGVDVPSGGRYEAEGSRSLDIGAGEDRQSLRWVDE